MTADPAAGATAPPAVPRWWAPLAALTTATVFTCALFVVANSIRPERLWYRYDDWLLTVVALLVPCFWGARRAAASATIRHWAGSRLWRALVATALAPAGVLSALAIAFAVLLWRGQVDASRAHDPASLPAGASDVRLAALARLATISDDEHRRLCAFLARDYRWMVTDWDRDRVAFLRGGDPGRRVHGSNGYQQQTGIDASRGQFRLGVFLDRTTAQRLPTPVDIVTAGTASTAVRLLRNPFGPERYTSRLWIEGRRTAVEVMEESDRPHRVTTNALLETLGEQLDRVLAAPGDAALDSLLEAGSLAGVDVPALSIDVDADDIDDGVGHGVYLVSGALNPGEEGAVTVRAFTAANQSLRVTSLPVAREYVGWSSDPGRRYRYGFEILVEDPEERGHIAVRFELWFTPMHGGAERRLDSVQREIRGYRY